MTQTRLIGMSEIGASDVHARAEGIISYFQRRKSCSARFSMHMICGVKRSYLMLLFNKIYDFISNAFGYMR